MYDYFQGHVVAKTPTVVVVEVAGVGFRAEVSLRTSERLPSVGAEARIWAYVKMHEDKPRLFGFFDEGERDLFVALQSVAGIGPAHGLALLSGYEPNEIWERIRDDDAKGLARTKGIGPKIAQRACIELKEKALRHIAKDASAPDRPRVAALDDATSALLVLGYSEAQARKATEKAASSLPSDAPLEDLVREALRNT